MPAIVQCSTLPLFVVAFCASAGQAQELLFQRRLAQVNDVSKQVIRCDLEATRTIRLQNQLVDESPQTLRRRQQRSVTILAITDHMPTRARIDYDQSLTTGKNGDDAEVRMTHPVASKSYLAELVEGKLRFLTAEGKPPTPEEEEILRRHLATFGKPNPLAQFLHGKRVRVGGSIVVPKEVASELLGFTGNNGEADSLKLHLRQVRDIDGHPCGVFETILRTHNADTSMNLLMRGQLVIEADTCRTRSIALHGPIAMSEVRGPAQGRFVVTTSGNLKVAVDATFEQRGKIARQQRDTPR